MNVSQVSQYIIDSEMDLDELILERLEMSHEDLVAELIGHIKVNIKNFQDLERHN
jgi:hypothetical protein